MPESSQPPHPPVSTVGRMLATVALLHGTSLDDHDHGLRSSGLDATTATALVDAVAYLTSSGDTDGADALLRLVTADPDTIAAAHVALHVPARRPTSAAPTGEPPPPLPRRVPRPYRDPGTPDPTAGSSAAPPAAEPRDGSGNGAEHQPLSETRRWQDATAAQVLLLDYAITDAEGRVTGVYTPVPIVHPPGWCDHLDTICGGCLAGWSEDHAVAVFRHGLHGAATGCRCPVCRATIPTRSPTPPDRQPDPDGPGDPDGSTSRDASWFGGEGS